MGFFLRIVINHAVTVSRTSGTPEMTGFTDLAAAPTLLEGVAFYSRGIQISRDIQSDSEHRLFSSGGSAAVASSTLVASQL